MFLNIHIVCYHTFFMSLFFSQFIDYKVYNQWLSPITIKWYKRSFGFLSGYLPDLDDLSIYQDHKKWSYAMARISEYRWWSPVSYNTMRKLYNTFCTYLVDEWIIIHNPFDKIPKMKEPKRIPKSYSLNQVSDIKKYTLSVFPWLNFLDIRNKALILTLLYTWIRRDELLKLETSRIDIINKTIYIFQWKGNKDRIVPIPDILYPYIEKYALLRNQTFFNTRSDFFFCAKAWWKLTAKNLYYVFKKIKEKTGFDVTTHRFRHTYATELIRNNIDVFNVSKILGHSDIRTTQIYLTANVAKIADSINSVALYH